jgi:hypothetical protein
MASRAAARSIARGELDLCVCTRCGFVFNRGFDPSLLAYGEEYDNTQSHSPSFSTYMDELVRHMIDERGVRNARIVEVGCGKGLFLRRLVEPAAFGNVGWGFDPSYLGPDTDADGRLQFRRQLYGPGCETLRADVVVCRHVIEHVVSPLALLQTVRAALALSPGARVFFETPCVDWILRNQVFWDFFYEHCSLFSPASLTTAFTAAGFRVEGIRRTFGDQYLWLEATVATDSSVAPPPDAGELPALAAAFGRAEQELVERWTRELSASAAHGATAIWGAGAKGVTLANLTDPDGRFIDCIVDLNPQKQGRFLPGTGHPIVAPADLAARGVTRAILMNPNYRDENLNLLRQAGLNLELRTEPTP